MKPKRLISSAPVALGLLTVAWPLAWSPAWTYLVAGLGGFAVLAAARWGSALAVASAVVSCAAADAPVAVLAVEGLVILGYLVSPGPWARGQLPLVAAGALTGAAVLAAFAVRPSGSAWLALAGLAAAVAAYLVAMPKTVTGKLLRRELRGPGPLTDVTDAIEGRLRTDSMGSRDEQ